MSLHIPISTAAAQELRRQQWRTRLSSLGICLAFILFGGSILYFTAIFIKTDHTPSLECYIQAAEDAPPIKNPRPNDLSSKSNPSAPTIGPIVLVSDSPSTMTLAPIPLHLDLGMAPTNDFNTGLQIGSIGKGMGDNPAGMGSSQAGGSALEGTYYDFKQTKLGADTGITWDRKTYSVMGDKSLNQLANIIGEFITKNWSSRIFERYYQAETKLYATNFYIPNICGKYGPIAFQAEKKIQPSAWAAVYRGKVRAPKTGRFRFVGAGNHLICVRFDRKLVLEAGWAVPSLYKKNDKNPWKSWGMLGTSKEYQDAIKSGSDRTHKDYKLYPMPEIAGWNRSLGGMVGGQIFEVKEGQVYPIEILVTDPAGGTFGFALLIEDVDNPHLIDGKPLFDLFRTNFSLPDKDSLNEAIKKAGIPASKMEFPPYNPDSYIWTAVS